MSFAFWKSSNSASSVPETKTKSKDSKPAPKESAQTETPPHQGMGGYGGRGDAERKKYIDSLTDN